MELQNGLRVVQRPGEFGSSVPVALRYCTHPVAVDTGLILRALYIQFIDYAAVIEWGAVSLTYELYNASPQTFSTYSVPYMTAFGAMGDVYEP